MSTSCPWHPCNIEVPSRAPLFMSIMVLLSHTRSHSSTVGHRAQCAPEREGRSRDINRNRRQPRERNVASPRPPLRQPPKPPGVRREPCSSNPLIQLTQGWLLRLREQLQLKVKPEWGGARPGVWWGLDKSCGPAPPRSSLAHRERDQLRAARQRSVISLPRVLIPHWRLAAARSPRAAARRDGGGEADPGAHGRDAGRVVDALSSTKRAASPAAPCCRAAR